MIIVRPCHLTELGYCRRGSRNFFKRRGLDWPRFLEHGIDAKELIALNDAMATRLVEVAKKWH